jgi:hypothetical protein
MLFQVHIVTYSHTMPYTQDKNGNVENLLDNQV